MLHANTVPSKCMGITSCTGKSDQTHENGDWAVSQRCAVAGHCEAVKTRLWGSETAAEAAVLCWRAVYPAACCAAAELKVQW